MKKTHFSIFRRITILVFTLTTALGLLFMLITYLATTHFYQASTQLLNKDVAAHIATFTSPFEAGGLNRLKADSVFHNAMVISPSAEVYFLDNAGRVIYFYAAPKEIKKWQIPLAMIHKYIQSGGKIYIKGDDPKDPSNQKIFSAAAVEGKLGRLGYIYVILGSKEFLTVTQMLYKSQVTNIVFGAFCLIMIISILISVVYINRLQQRFTNMIKVLKRFEQGDLDARFAIAEKDEMAAVAGYFNKMADLLVYNIKRLTDAEEERKNFIINISHDLRTPLSIARGYTETMLIKEKGDISPEKEKEFLQLVVAKIQQVENMAKQLFELSKMESGPFEIITEPFIFSEILEEVIKDYTLKAEEKNIRIDCDNCNNPSWIKADIGLIERVIQNLMVNALSYTPENNKISVSLNHASGELIFSIANEGEPLPDDMVRWINSDQDSHESVKPVRLAIGLSIVKKILHFHGFPFHAEVNPQLGNVFSFGMKIYSL